MTASLNVPKLVKELKRLAEFWKEPSAPAPAIEDIIDARIGTAIDSIAYEIEKAMESDEQ